MDEITGMDRRDFLKMLASLGLTPPSLYIPRDGIEKDVTAPQSKTTKQTLTPLQKLASRTEPPKYDQKRVYRQSPSSFYQVFLDS